MFDHFAVDSHTEFGDSSSSSYDAQVLESEGYNPQEVQYIEEIYSQLSPSEISYIEQEDAALAQMPSSDSSLIDGGGSSQVDEQIAQEEAANAEQTMNDTLNQAESFDQNVLGG